MVCPQCTQISRSFCCLNSKALGDTFSIMLNKDLLLLAYCRAASASRYISAGLGYTTGQGSKMQENRVWLQTGNYPSVIWRPTPWQPHLGDRWEKNHRTDFLLHTHFRSFKYCDKRSALFIRIQAQEPSLASIMNTMRLSWSFSSQVKSPSFQQEQNQSNKNRKMGSWHITLLF